MPTRPIHATNASKRRRPGPGRAGSGPTGDRCELRDSEARLRAYFHASPEYLSVVRLTADGAIVYDDLNPACEALFGRTRADVVGRTPADILGPDSAKSVDLYARECLRTGQTLNYEVERTYHTGQHIVANVVVAPIDLPGKEGTLVLFCGRDLTKQRRAEDALRQSQKMEAVGQLTGGVAHDFNNLLTVLRSSVDLLKRPNLSDERRRRYIEAISDATTRAARLTGQLLAFARRQALKPEVFDVGHSIATIGDIVATLTGAGIRIETRMPAAPATIDADRSQFETAIVNLVVNARDAMDGGGRLTIGVDTTGGIPPLRGAPAVAGDFVAITIGDTGYGIAPTIVDRIFEPFFTTKGVGHGTGLGLSQVFGFVKESGGDVAVSSEPGRETLFTLYLPRVAATRRPATPQEEEMPVDGQDTCVLVVEDNGDVGAFATQALQELGYSVVLAIDADTALAELGRDAARFDVVFSDVVMPGMNGIELGQEIHRRHAGLPVVLTSGYSHILAHDGTHGFDLLHKPYSIGQLSRLLRKTAYERQMRRALR